MNFKIAALTLVFFLFFSCGKTPFSSSRDSGSATNTVSGLSLPLMGGKLQLVPFWNKGPLISDESKLTLVLLDKDNQTASLPEGLELHVKLWMPTMGHGSFPVSVAKSEVQGVFEISDVFFTMDGYWDVHFQLLNEAGKLIEEIKWGMTL